MDNEEYDCRNEAMKKLNCDSYSTFNHEGIEVIEFVNSKAIDSCEYPFYSHIYHAGNNEYERSKFDFESVDKMREFIKKDISQDIFNEKVKEKKRNDLNHLKELGLYNPDKNDFSNPIDDARFEDVIDIKNNKKYKRIQKDKTIKQKNQIESYPGEFCDRESLCRETNDSLKINDGYEETKILECLKCGGRNFNVGQGCLFTAISCVNCKWEKSIHEG